MAAIEPLHIQCPACGEVFDVPITSRVETTSEGDEAEAQVNLVLDPDLSEIWLHAWTAHGASEQDGEGQDG